MNITAITPLCGRCPGGVHPAALPGRMQPACGNCGGSHPAFADLFPISGGARLDAARSAGLLG